MSHNEEENDTVTADSTERSAPEWIHRAELRRLCTHVVGTLQHRVNHLATLLVWKLNRLGRMVALRSLCSNNDQNCNFIKKLK